ncbi:MAG TPA: DUF3108 domain-containing protein [Candidatus Eisenbacteria bacterium]|uniref:DUF3108 domain-containing protein n=1 Tax=Eiseniibacteriota bacterium TaxID=2212470 RepID=A0A7V2AW51_UNCEI|nr:DUF3108 domain-containing protein [Candidatus Eisenbacteria bacterium]
MESNRRMQEHGAYASCVYSASFSSSFRDGLRFGSTSSGETDEQLEGFELIYALPEQVPYGEGEHLVFAIQYGLIYAGDATLEIRNIAVIDSVRTYHVISTARTNKAFDIVFKVRDRVESFIDYENLFSLRFEKHLREGKFKKDEEVEFDQQQHLARYADKTVPIPPNTQDFLSALYYVRTLDIEVGQAIAMANHTGGKNYPIYVKILGRERVTVPAGTFDCIVVEPVLQTTGIFEHKGKLTIWLTDDTLKMPVLMRSKVVIGAFEAVLKSYRTSDEPPRILRRETGEEHE